jgi:hypothetical protein
MAVFCGHTTREGDETTVIDTASDDEELDDIFGQARSAVERTAPQVRVTALNFVPLIY